MRIRRFVAVLVVTLVTLGAGSVAIVGGAGAAGALAGPSTAAAPGTVLCERLAARATEVPGIRARIRTQLAAIETQLDAIVNPVRRARVAERLRPRIDGLRALDARLAAQVAEAERRCANLT